MTKKSEEMVTGRVGLISPRVLTLHRKRQRAISMEEKERLVAQAKAAYEIRINPPARIPR
ncbi:MAG: hypothetical protein IJ635_08995 [Bacteroidaceae bacterium]|nr:hypothetical protein [Bacteroidaceae bacterium]